MSHISLTDILITDMDQTRRDLCYAVKGQCLKTRQEAERTILAAMRMIAWCIEAAASSVVGTMVAVPDGARVGPFSSFDHP